MASLASLADGGGGGEGMTALGSELPAMFDGVKMAALATVLYVIMRCLNLKSPPSPPEVSHQDTPLTRYLLKCCPLLTKE